jgi:hypothetical protein
MMMPHRVAFFLFAIVVAASCFGGGSIGWEDVRKRMARDDPEFLAWIDERFDIRPSGGAVRVGHDTSGKSTVEGSQIGDRLPPFEFPAKPKGTGGDYTLYLTFDYSGRQQATKPLWQVTVRRKLQSD